MAKVITFSRIFPAYHPKAGSSTYFVEQIWNGLNAMGLPVPKNSDLPNDFMWSILPLSNFGTKVHTIRSGKRWKAGDTFSPRVWSGKPYNSKQIVIAPDIEIKHIWDFEMDINGIYVINGKYTDDNEKLAKNDGLTEEEMFHWFMPDYHRPKTFSGQIICWSDDVQY